jgi:hypothetical protein
MKYVFICQDILFITNMIYLIKIKLCMVDNDPLRMAFNVKAFHRCQATSLS